MPLDLSQLKSSELFDRIINILTIKFTSLPSKGVVAGQSVASAIYEIVGLSNDGPYRDLDVFFEQSDFSLGDKIKYSDSKIRINRIAGGVNDKLSKSSYDGIFKPINKNGYVILDCQYRPNNHNYIFVKFESSLVYKVDCIVDGFDLNCCECGIDLTTRRVYWTNAFEQFLKNPEIEFTSYLTPAHTMVRAAKKSDDLPFASFNSNGQILKCQTVRKYILDREKDCQESSNHNGYFAGHMFSNGYMSRFENYKHILSEHFDIHSNPVKIVFGIETVSFYRLTPRSWDKDLLNLFETYFSLTKCDSHKEKSLTSGFYNIENDLFYINEIIKTISLDNWKTDEFFKIMDIAKSGKVRPDGIRFLLNTLYSDKAKLLKSMSNEEKIQAAKLIASHQSIGAIIYLCLDNDTIRKIIKTIRKIDKSKYRFIIGDIENDFRIQRTSYPVRLTSAHGFVSDSIRPKSPYSKITYGLRWLLMDRLDYILERKYQEKILTMDNIKLDPIFTDIISTLNPSNYLIRELVSEQELFNEGNDLLHCVGGKRYWESIKSGRDFIFSIINRTEKHKRCTLQVNGNRLLNNRVKLEVVQNKAYKNTTPDKGLLQFSKDFLSHANGILCPESKPDKNVFYIGRCSTSSQFIESLDKRLKDQ